MIEEFEKNCNKLTFQNTAKFTNFRECLSDAAEDRWDTVLAVTAHPQANAGFELYLQEFYSQYVHEDAKDVIIEYMASKECIKKRSTNMLDPSLLYADNYALS